MVIRGGFQRLEESKCDPVFEKDEMENPESYMSDSLILIPGKVTEQVILKTISKHKKDKKKVICTDL